MTRASASGFTLIELMVTIAVMAVVASMALPAFNQMVHNNRRTTAINDLLATIHIARSEAITRNRFVSVCRSNASQTACVASAGDWRDGWIAFFDTDQDAVLDSGEEIVIIGESVSPALSLVSEHFTWAMSFRPNGRVASSDGVANRFREILVCDTGADEASRVITVEWTGRASASELTRAGTAGDCTLGA